MLRLLGQGTFGRVVECFDRKQRTYCAIKIIRSVQKYRDASHVEIKILNRLKTQDPSNRNKCIHLREWFDYENHICMVFDLFDLSIFDFLKSNNFRPFPLIHIQQIAKQLLTSIAFLHSLKVIHTDIKPENILLVSSAAVSQSSNSKTDTPPYLTLKSTDIRVIDFGSATDEKGPNCTVVSTRHYRAPEIILGTGWSYPCDIWSIGCVLVEMFTGNALFQTHDNLEHLAMMESVLGKFPEFMVQMSLLNGQTYFRDNLTLAYPTTTTPKNSIKYVRQLKPLHQIVKRTQTHGHLLDLLKKMLDYSPNKRITAREALRHPFFQTKM
ncbi:kinase-like domain-containing protein [Gongronella butleri]|nr:kinase-like domain-containing protein [Gongronella butleri]